MLQIKKHKILIIGFGSIGEKHYFNIKKILPNAEIAVLRTSQKKKKNYKIKFLFRLKDALKFNPNKVLICSPSNKHAFYFSKFKNLKCELFIEKPLLANKNDLKYFENYKKNVLVGYFLRQHPTILYLKKILKKKIHKVRHVNFEVGYDLKKWRKNRDYKSTVSAKKELGGGAFLELSHELDLATWIFGYPTEIFCSKKKYSNLKINTDDISEIYLNFPKKKMSVLIHVDLIQKSYSRNIKIILDDETIYFNFNKNTLYRDNGYKVKKIKYYTNNNLLLKKQTKIFLYKNYYLH